MSGRFILIPKADMAFPLFMIADFQSKYPEDWGVVECLNFKALRADKFRK
jgi:hypothetical protein